jgi:protein-disulfide isomerase
MTQRQFLLSSKIFLLFVLFLGLSVPGAQAQTVTPQVATVQALMQQTETLDSDLFNRNAKPLDINAVPVLANIVKGGAKLFYLGERSGLHGWFIVKDGQIQMIYVTSDGQTALIGGMFTKDGVSVTEPQITNLTNTNKELAEMLNSASKQQEDVTKAGTTPGGFAAVPGNATAAAGKGLAGNLPPSVTISPGERLMQDLQAAASVKLGNNANAELLVVIDPNCPHCQATWRELREPVLANQVQVRLIPVSNNLNGESARVAGQLLQTANPFEAWDKYVGGDKKALAGEPDALHAKAVVSNRVIVDKWNISSTPYIVYRAKDGRVKIVQGQPERMAAVLTDLLK